ncbi:hypothetical protein [Streptomyces monashensis]|uniref:Uncharacterized protein n=1 Tax=Streptomyces monashensis TaxID=1678012 RepID=A0A1S2PHY2_9ACTN|nr:hypothetical protein [Streptomyces monashensis]OIJ93166.1 hypothetical protein BIV23_37510 [Streptomyces monashensis]
MSAPSTPRPSDSPAGALGPLSLVLGAVAAASAWPTLTFLLFPWPLLAGGLAVTFGGMGIHYAGRGHGGLWTSVTGTVLGAVGLAAFVLFFVTLY